MAKWVSIFCIVFLMFISCKKNNSASNEQKQNSTEYLNDEKFASGAETDDLPIIMYINSKEGLNLRNEPSLQGRKIGTLLYGLRVIVNEKHNIDTIEGVTDYWYKISGHFGSGYVFGSFLSKKIPVDVPPILGRWDSEKEKMWSWWFAPPDIVSAGFKWTNRGWYGKWELTGNILTITESNEFEHKEFGEELKIKITILKIEIIDTDNIILHYENGEQEKLIRSNELF
jgi:hypothetical protein